MDVCFAIYRKTRDKLTDSEMAELIDEVLYELDFERDNFGKEFVGIVEEDLDETEHTDCICKVDGKMFYCECGCNVFRKLKANSLKYKCNACDAVWVGEK